MKTNLLKAMVALALVAPGVVSAAYNQVWWNAADGDFATAANWKDGIAPTENASLINIANDGIMRIGADFTCGPAIRVGIGSGAGTVIQTAGTFTVNSGNGNNAVGIGNYFVTDTATGESLWRISGGRLYAASYLQIGEFGRGALEVCGPDAVVECNTYTSIGRFTNGVGRVLVTDGLFHVLKNGLIVGEDGVGTLTVLSNGVATVDGGTFRMGATSFADVQARGTVTVADGGRLVAPEVTTLRTGAFHFAGGTWQINASGQTIATLFPAAITCAVGDGGLFLDVGSNDVTVPNPLASEDDQTGALVKLGTGTLRLTAANTYAGGTIVSNGILHAASAAALPGYDRAGGVFVASGAYLVTGDGWTAAELETLAANAVYEDSDPNAYTWTDGILSGSFGDGIPADKYLKLAGGAFAGADGVVTNALGTAPGQIAFQKGATAGFSANANDVTVTLPETLVWGSALFAPAALVLNHADAQGNLVLASGLDLHGVTNATVSVGAGTTTVTGGIADAGDGTTLQKVGAGTLALAGTNAFKAVTVTEGTLAAPTGSTTLAGTLWQRYGAVAITGGVFTAKDVRFEEGTTTVQNAKLVVTGGARVGATSNTTNPGKLAASFTDATLEIATCYLGPDTAHQAASYPFTNVDGTFRVLRLVRGHLVQNGGTIRSTAVVSEADENFQTDSWQIGSVSRPEAVSWTVNGGTVTCARDFQIGAQVCFGGGADLLTLDGGATVTVGGWPSIGRYAGSTGRVDVVNGTFTQSNAEKRFNVGEYGDGTLHIFKDGVVNAHEIRLAVAADQAASGRVIVDQGGTLNVGKISVGEGTGVKELKINGGTLKATGADGTVIGSGLTTLEVGAAGLTLDTNGRTVYLGDRKAASGAGTLRLSEANMLHRWSFNGDLADAVGGQTATLVGSGAALTANGTCRLNGGAKGSGYISLGSGILPRSGEGVTLEVWGTQRAHQSWSRIFTIGNGVNQDVLMAWSNDTSVNTDCICIKEASTDIKGKLAPYTYGTEFHIAMTIAPSATTTGRWDVTCYKQDAVTGETLKKTTFTSNNDAWSPFTQVCNDAWLGHSHHGDNDASADFNEFRVWNIALTEAELTESAKLGADAVLSGAHVVKTGAGRLVVRDGSAVTVGADVREGTLEIGAGALAHRWSFNGDLTDSVGGLTATSLGTTTLSATQVTLPGGGHGTGAVDLGANVLPTDGAGFTLEFWATQNAVKSWSRIFELGSQLGNAFLMAWTGGTSIDTDDVCIKGSNGGKDWRDALAPYTLGREFHIVVTVAPNADGTWHVTCVKQDPQDASAEKSFSFDTTGTWSPATQNQAQCYLGRSHASNDADAAASYNEVRVWNVPLTAEQIDASCAAGPDTLPALFASDATLTAQAVVMVAAGATLDLSGGTHACATLAGAGTLAHGAITGSIHPAGAGTVGTLTLDGATLAGTLLLDATAAGACDRLVSLDAFDARGLTVALEEGAELSHGRSYLIATFPANAFTGPFAGEVLPRGWSVRVNPAAGTVKLAGGGCTIFIR